MTLAVDTLRRRTLDWLSTMAAGGPGEYRLHAAAEPTPFASCFAAFLRHLFGDLDALAPADRAAWVTRLQQLQRQDSGLFVDDSNDRRATDALHDADHLNFQLTSFCLGALHALGARPVHPLRCTEAWTPDGIRRRLDALDWSQPWNSGNKAMFLGICLAYAATHGGEARAGATLEAWFDWHDAHQNPDTGFWGDGFRARYIDGLGGAYHQFTVYNYMGRPVRHHQRIIDRTLMLQQPDGMYSPYLGGMTCYELDAVDVLVHLYARHDYRRAEIEASLRRTLDAVASAWNADGGFCWGRRRAFRGGDWLRLLGEAASHRDPAYLYLSARAALSTYTSRHAVLRNGWSRAPRGWHDSSIFDTWFRCVTIAEIAAVVPHTPYSGMGWQPLDVPGLGWFRLPAPAAA